MTETKKHRVWSAVAIAGAILLLLVVLIIIQNLVN